MKIMDGLMLVQMVQTTHPPKKIAQLCLCFLLRYLKCLYFTCILLAFSVYQMYLLYSRTGFKLTWTTHACGGHVTSPGEIHSPLHPDTYFHNTNCTWVISAPPGKVVELKFDYLDLESHYRNI